MITYVLFNPLSKKLIGIDQASGGYPYDVTNLNGIHVWTNLKDAKAYQKMFPAFEIKIFTYQLFDL
jgi:hypothetical protein